MTVLLGWAFLASLFNAWRAMCADANDSRHDRRDGVRPRRDSRVAFTPSEGHPAPTP